MSLRVDNMSRTCLFLFNPHTNPERRGYRCFYHFTWRTLCLNLLSDLYTCHHGDTGNAEPGFEPWSIWPWSSCCSPSLHNYYAALYYSFHFGGHLTVALYRAPGDIPDLYSMGAEVGHVRNSAMFPSSCGQERRVSESSWCFKSLLFPAARLIHIQVTSIPVQCSIKFWELNIPWSPSSQLGINYRVKDLS